MARSPPETRGEPLADRALEKQGKLKAAREELREEWKINPDPQVKKDLERVENCPPVVLPTTLSQR
jgi:hypothetical protein